MVAAQAPIPVRDDVQEEDRVWLALSYFGPLAFIPLRSRSVARYVKFHARQGVGLFILYCVVAILGLVPLIGPVLWVVGTLGYLIVTVLAIRNGLQGLRWRVPGAAWLIDLFTSGGDAKP